MADIKLTDYAGMQVSTSSMAFMNPMFVARRAKDLILPKLMFMDMFPTITKDAPRYSYEVHSYDAESSLYKRYPPNVELGGEWAMVDFEDITMAYGEFAARGFQVKFGPEVLENPGMTYNRVQKMLKYLGHWAPQAMNTQLVTDIVDDFDVTVDSAISAVADLVSGIASDIGTHANNHIVGTLDTDRRWSASGADPIQDIRDLLRVFEFQGKTGRYPYKPTDVYMGIEAAKYLTDFIIDMGGKLQTDEHGVWVLEPIGGYKVNLHIVTLSDGWETTTGQDYLLILDRNSPAAETYQYLYKSYKNNGLMNYQVIEDEDKQCVYYRWWYKRDTRVVDPRALWLIRVV
jgi:hypothetical protein